jgi:hypothetical protein
MHSYGGLVGSNTIPKELGFEYRKLAGLCGGVFHLLYIAGLVLDKGQSVLGTFGESPNNDVKVSNTAWLISGHAADHEPGRWPLLFQEWRFLALQ